LGILVRDVHIGVILIFLPLSARLEDSYRFYLGLSSVWDRNNGDILEKLDWNPPIIRPNLAESPKPATFRNILIIGAETDGNVKKVGFRPER